MKTTVAIVLLEMATSMALARNSIHRPVPAITFAASFGNVSKVLRLLRRGAAVDERDWVGQTALHMAAKFDRPVASKVLLQHGASAKAKNADYFETPLHNTAKTGNKRIFQLLLDHGADIDANAVNAEFPGGTPLIYCVEFSNSVDACRMLLEKGANVSAVNSRKQTPLHFAVINNNFKMTQEILAFKAQVDAKDENGNTALNLLAALQRPQIPLMALLIRKSADVNTRNNQGQTPLDKAVEIENLAVVVFLLQHGARPETKHMLNLMILDKLQAHFDFVSELIFDVAFGRMQRVEDFLQHHRPNAIDRNDWLNQTALHVAAMFGRSKIARTLLRWRPDINAVDGNGLTPLHQAARAGDRAFLQLLVDARATIDADHPVYGTPLATACQFANAFVSCAKVLLKAGAQVNKADQTVGYYPLHWATLHQNLKTMQLLLQNGAAVDAKSKKGETPLNLIMGNVCCYPQLPAVQFLLDHGADINSRDSSGCTPLCKALKAEKRLEIIQYLTDRGGTI